MLAMMASQLSRVALRLAKVALRLPRVALKLPKVALELAQVALPLADKARSSFRLAHRKPPRNHASVGSNVAGASIIGMSKNSAESGAVTVSLQNQVVPSPTIFIYAKTRYKYFRYQQRQRYHKTRSRIPHVINQKLKILRN